MILPWFENKEENIFRPFDEKQQNVPMYYMQKKTNLRMWFQSTMDFPTWPNIYFQVVQGPNKVVLKGFCHGLNVKKKIFFSHLMKNLKCSKMYSKPILRGHQHVVPWAQFYTLLPHFSLFAQPKGQRKLCKKFFALDAM